MWCIQLYQKRDLEEGMKRKLFLLFMVVVLVFALAAAPAFAKGKKGGAYSAVKKGNILLGGDVDLHITKSNLTADFDEDDWDNSKITLTDFGIGGLCGYFVIKGLEVGGLFEWTSQTTEMDDDEEVNKQFTLAAQTAYFYPFSKNFSVFGLGALGYLSATEESETKNNNNTVKTEFKYSGIFIEPRGGVAFHANKNFALFAALFFRFPINFEGEWDGGGNNQQSDFEASGNTLGLKVGAFGFL